MKECPKSIEELSSSTRQEMLAGVRLDSARAVMATGAEDDLVLCLVAQLEAELGNRNDAIRNAMSLLERAMEYDPVVAGCLMGSLYPLAAQAYLHEVCDAIEIWLYEYHPLQLADMFRRKASGITAGYMGRKYVEWADAIDAAAK